jgi:alpha-beta hydrolase superfamily lysophospholipase
VAIYFHKDNQFDFELVRTMGQASYGGAEIGECLATAARIVEGDYDSWYEQWSDTARWLYARSDEAVANGHRISARDGFLRCANYFRTAEFFLHDDPSDSRIRESSTRAVESFHRAAALFNPPIDVVDIPYEGSSLPGYFYPAQTREPGPHATILIHNGFDGTAEEIFSFSGRAGQERGYNILAFDGPGQGQVIRQNGMAFRPDWEAVVGPVIDYVETRPDVDDTRIGLIGISMGGVLGPRAAAFEPRLSAVVAWDGVYDMQAVPLDFVFADHPDDKETLKRRFAAADDPALDAYIDGRVHDNGAVRWMVGHGKWVLGAETARDLFHRWGEFSLRGGIAEQIRCPVLVLKAENDATLKGQPEALAKHLTAPYTFYEFTAERGGDLHNQVDVHRYAASVIYDWFDTVLH